MSTIKKMWKCTNALPAHIRTALDIRIIGKIEKKKKKKKQIL